MGWRRQGTTTHADLLRFNETLKSRGPLFLLGGSGDLIVFVDSSVSSTKPDIVSGGGNGGAATLLNERQTHPLRMKTHVSFIVRHKHKAVRQAPRTFTRENFQKQKKEHRVVVRGSRPLETARTASRLTCRSGP